MASFGEDTLASCARRLRTTLNHVKSQEPKSSFLTPEPASMSAAPWQQNVESELKWNGWGYADTQFDLNEEGQIYLTGKRYALCGKAFPLLRPWVETTLQGIDLNQTTPACDFSTLKLPKPIIHDGFCKDVEQHCQRITFDGYERLHHGHGHTCEDIFALRQGHVGRIPDAVIYPSSNEDVEFIVKRAHECDVCIIPYGGGTSVTEALSCPSNEKRMIISLDMKSMNAIKWIDRESMLACIEAGAVGMELEKRLAGMGLCLGHEPDSFEFSTLGGWVATRASGMKKNYYGNIEDIIVSVTMVTPKGVMSKSCHVPRMSTGPDINHIIMGSEGILGVVTEAVVKLRPLPAVKEYGAFVFPDFESGVGFMQQLGISNCSPASIRLTDNVQFQFGQVLKPEGESTLDMFFSKLKKLYITKWHKFDVNQMTAATVVYEGTHEEVNLLQKQVARIAAKYQGINAGPENGRRGYFLTYMIAYFRDLGLQYGVVTESFETSIPWSNVNVLCKRVKQQLKESCARKGIVHEPFISCRISQTYGTGACVYFYFGFVYKDLDDPMKVFAEVESEARDMVLSCGGSLSHHHGVGKLRKKWMEETVSSTGIQALRGIKQSLDPKNIFVSGNLI